MNLEYTRNKNFPVIEKTTNPRKARAETMMKLGLEPKHYKKGVYAIPSQSNPKKAYMVFETKGRWFCSCPDRRFRKIKCKHIFLFQMWSEMKQALLDHSEVETPQEIIMEEGAISCKYCNSMEIVKNGSRKTKAGKKTRYLCRNCNGTFVLDDGFKKVKFTPEIITLCLDLYFKGTSTRKITEHVKLFHGLSIHHTTILKWLKKYTQIISEYVSTLEPKVGDTWHTDEMMVKNGGDWSWVWNVIDGETRFLLSNLVSKRRSVIEARQVFRSAKEQAKGRPSEMVTDGLWSYKMAFKKEFYAKRGTKPILTHKAGVNKEDNNNVVERFNGTVREREKVMRGMQNEETAQDLMEGFRNYYNFIRPHQALNGKTPAEVAGLDLELDENKWKSLIEKAVKHRYKSGAN
jgi:transposase-like protein